MLKDIVSVKPLSDGRLHLRFEDGAEGTVSVMDIVPYAGVFAPLSDPVFFAQVRVNPELGSIEWPNGADLDPDVLYAQITGQPIREFVRR